MDDVDEMTVQLEYENIPSGSSGKSYFTMSMFKRKLKKAFYPQRELSYNAKKNPYAIRKVDGEIRIMSVDVATRANKVNDNTIIVCVRLIPMVGKGYKRELVYIESHKGVNTNTQAKRIKEVFHDFECDWIVLDILNAGIGVYDALTQVTRNDERGIDYEPMTIVDVDYLEEKAKKDLQDRTLGINPLEVIYPISATAPLNSKIAVAFRTALKSGLWSFLCDQNEAEEFLIKTNKEFLGESSDRAFFLNPYIGTELLIGECVNLDMKLSAGLIKLEERENTYKDRYSAISYLNWIVSSEFDSDLLAVNEEQDNWDIIESVTFVL
jgi:hypothetical protein